ncbi:hypothetical protein QQ045_016874 [Rhodiola kirilowii]
MYSSHLTTSHTPSSTSRSSPSSDRPSSSLWYSLCDWPRLSSGPYLGITAICSLSSLVFVVVKAYYFFHSARRLSGLRAAMEVALFVCSAVLAVSHVVVAYRVNRRERRKLLVYKIDIEAVVSKNGFPTRYSKLLQLEERTQ